MVCFRVTWPGESLEAAPHQALMVSNRVLLGSHQSQEEGPVDTSIVCVLGFEC